jgi:hypothetical protein
MNRKKFLQQSVTGAGFIIGVPVFVSAGVTPPENDPLPSDKVKEFVIAGHGNLDQVKKLLTEFPTLLYATWDW